MVFISPHPENAMNHETDQAKRDQPETGDSEYMSPRIESVMTPADLEREVHYAGTEDGISLQRP